MGKRVAGMNLGVAVAAQGCLVLHAKHGARFVAAQAADWDAGVP